MNGQKFSKSTATFTGIQDIYMCGKESGSHISRILQRVLPSCPARVSVLIRSRLEEDFWNFVKSAKNDDYRTPLYPDLPSLLKEVQTDTKSFDYIPICTVCSRAAASLSLNRWNTQRRKSGGAGHRHRYLRFMRVSARFNRFLC